MQLGRAQYNLEDLGMECVWGKPAQNLPAEHSDNSLPKMVVFLLC